MNCVANNVSRKVPGLTPAFKRSSGNSNPPMNCCGRKSTRPTPESLFVPLRLTALTTLPAVRRAFVSEAQLQHCAERRASSAFTEHGLHLTAAHTGVLILVALFEHRVVVLADEGVHRRLGAGHSWQEVVDLVLAGIRSGRAAEGIAEAVRRCGEILEGPLPPVLPEEDEIRVSVVLED